MGEYHQDGRDLTCALGTFGALAFLAAIAVLVVAAVFHAFAQ